MVKNEIMEIFEELRHEKMTNIKEVAQYCMENNKSIILFGAGSIGINCARRIKEFFSIPMLFCDNDPTKWGTKVEDIPVLSFEEVRDKHQNAFIVITSLYYYDQILDQLKEYNMDSKVVSGVQLFYNDDYANYAVEIQNTIQKYEEAYNSLEDDKSKQIFIERIKFCLTTNYKYLIPLRSHSSQYFENEILSISDNEVFIDGGAFTGDTVEEFLRETTGKFRRILSFEPEKTKHDEFLRKFSGTENIELHPHGLWDKPDVLRFHAENNGGSHVGNNGNVEVTVTSIDEVLQGEPATFIKMDIEGAELKALQGAEKTIRKYKPKLAICIYHKPHDVVDIPLFIKQLVPEYKIYMRHYNVDLYETVCYATIN